MAGTNGVKRGGANGGGGAGVTAARESKQEQAQFSKFDSASTDQKIIMLNANDSYGQETLWDHANSQASDVTVTRTKDNRWYIRETKSYLTLNNALANQNDSVSILRGRMFIYKDKKGNYFLTRMTQVVSSGGSIKVDIKKLPW